MHWAAAWGFRILGADAQNAVPALIQIVEQHISEDSQAAACLALTGMGPEAARTAIPLLLRDAASTNAEVRFSAVHALSFAQIEPSQVVPALVKSLSDPFIWVRERAARGLGNFGTNAHEAVPALMLLLIDPNWGVRCDATNALKKIDPETVPNAAVVPALIKLLSDTNIFVRRRAARRLGDFGPNAQQAVPALVGMLNDQDEFARDAGTNALKAIDPEAAAKAGVK
jgi:HEAT repeat protein